MLLLWEGRILLEWDEAPVKCHLNELYLLVQNENQFLNGLIVRLVPYKDLFPLICFRNVLQFAGCIH